MSSKSLGRLAGSVILFNWDLNVRAIWSPESSRASRGWAIRMLHVRCCREPKRADVNRHWVLTCRSVLAYVTRFAIHFPLSAEAMVVLYVFRQLSPSADSHCHLVAAPRRQFVYDGSYKKLTGTR